MPSSSGAALEAVGCVGGGIVTRLSRRDRGSDVVNAVLAEFPHDSLGDSARELVMHVAGTCFSALGGTTACMHWGMHVALKLFQPSHRHPPGCFSGDNGRPRS